MNKRRSKAEQATQRLPLWRKLLLLLCAAGFTVFFLPIFGGILNSANLAAMGGFLLLAVAVLCWNAVQRLLTWLWRRGWGKVLLLLSGVGLAALAGVLLILTCRIAARLRAAPDGPCPTVLVLGCQVQGKTPSLMLHYRIEAAEDYLRSHPDAVAILSGGQGPGETISEAACMYRALTQRGIDPNRLYLEDASSVTLENLRFSKALLEREGLQTPVVIISNDFHIYRALKMAEDLGLPAQGLAASSNWWFSTPTYVLREALAMVKYELFAD